MDNDKSKRWCFTSWIPPKIDKMCCVEFMIWQEEFTQKDNLHYQGFVIFKKDYALFQVKSLFKDKTIHVEKTKYSLEINIKYCSKEKTATGKLSYIFGDKNLYFD
jgi:hypothetical protein